MRYKDLEIEVKQRFVKEVLFEFYPFTSDDIEDFKNILDFKIISKNQFIDWDYELVSKYNDEWDWLEIENNPIICKEVNLGLLYPNKVSIIKPKCNCYKKLDYCDMNKFCNSQYDRTKMIKKSTKYLNPRLCGFIIYLIEQNVINNLVLSNILLYDMDIDFAQDFEIENDSNVKDCDDYKDLPF